MVSVSEAESIILRELQQPVVEEVDVARSVGRVLAEKITADRDFPPFHRVSMDGIAIQSDRFKAGQRSFDVEGMQAAGRPQMKLTMPVNCIEVMTGAMLPVDTDAVIRYEDVDIGNSKASVLTEDVMVHQNVHPQGQDARLGDLLLGPGFKISPAEIALLASVGKKGVRVFKAPRIAIISTGDELVDIGERPQPWQIRRSNGYAVQAALRTMQMDGNLFHLIDDKEVLEKELGQIFKAHEVIILSGGVSKGKLDFIPQVLEQLGIQKLFHQVSQKPGKPFWFGRGKRQTVFALPGNPVSTYLCFYRYIKPWLEKSLGIESLRSEAILAKAFNFKPELTYFLQVKIVNQGGKLLAHPDPGGGSGDFANLKAVDGFLELPAERSEFKAGESFIYYSFR